MARKLVCNKIILYKMRLCQGCHVWHSLVSVWLTHISGFHRTQTPRLRLMTRSRRALRQPLVNGLEIGNVFVVVAIITEIYIKIISLEGFHKIPMRHQLRKSSDKKITRIYWNNFLSQLSLRSSSVNSINANYKESSYERDRIMGIANSECDDGEVGASAIFLKIFLPRHQKRKLSTHL